MEKSRKYTQKSIKKRITIVPANPNQKPQKLLLILYEYISKH